jgi:hypothetical protein
MLSLDLPLNVLQNPRNSHARGGLSRSHRLPLDVSWCLQEREAFIAEVVAERRRLADENAAASRAAEEARANLLDLKTRVAQYEAQASAALRQAHEEEAKATTAKEASAKERATLDDLKRELQVGKLKPLGGSVVCAVWY